MLCHVALRTQMVKQRIRSSVGRVTEDLIQRSWVRFPPRSKDFFFTSCGSLIPFTRLSGLFMGSISTITYTSEIILCFTICVLSATRHNIHIFGTAEWRSRPLDTKKKNKKIIDLKTALFRDLTVSLALHSQRSP